MMPDRAYKKELENEPINCPRCEQFKAGSIKDLLVRI